MDKQTLSNYGWIVITVLVLAVMLALATPFGEFIRDGFKATYEGFSNVTDKAFAVVGLGGNSGSGDEGQGGEQGGQGTPNEPSQELDLMPVGGIYTMFETGEQLIGDGVSVEFPARADMREKDTYKYGDYEYTLNSLGGWTAKALNRNQTSYGELLTEITGEFGFSASGTFSGCAKLETAPVIHSGITQMSSTFSGCTTLTGTVTINANPTSYTNCFKNVDFQAQHLTLAGECPDDVLDLIGATGINYCADCNGYCEDYVAPCTHENTFGAENNDGTHNIVCDGCGETLTKNESCYDNDSDTSCDVCGVKVEQEEVKYDNPPVAAAENSTYFTTDCDLNEIQSLNVIVETSDYDDVTGTYFAYKGEVNISSNSRMPLANIKLKIGASALAGDCTFYFYTDTSEYATKIICTISGSRISAVHTEPCAVLVKDLDGFSYLN